MKITLLTAVLFFCSLLGAKAQQKDTITFVKNKPYTYYKNGKKLTISELSDNFKNDFKTYNTIHYSQANRTVSLLVGAVGSCIAGYFIGEIISNKINEKKARREGYYVKSNQQHNYFLALTGVGLTAVSIPIGKKAEKNIRGAVLSSGKYKEIELMVKKNTSTTNENDEKECSKYDEATRTYIKVACEN